MLEAAVCPRKGRVSGHNLHNNIQSGTTLAPLHASRICRPWPRSEVAAISSGGFEILALVHQLSGQRKSWCPKINAARNPLGAHAGPFCIAFSHQHRFILTLTTYYTTVPACPLARLHHFPFRAKAGSTSSFKNFMNGFLSFKSLFTSLRKTPNMPLSFSRSTTTR